MSINWSILFSGLKGFDFIWDNNVKGRGFIKKISHCMSWEITKYFETISYFLCVLENITNLIV